MAYDTPLRPLPLQQRRSAQRSVLTERQLREHGVCPTVIADRSRPGGPWQQLLPKVFLLRPGTPTPEQRLQAALLYGGQVTRRIGRESTGRMPDRPVAMVTGLAALALHGLASAPAVDDLPEIDVLVPHQRRVRDTAFVRIRRSHTVPTPTEIAGLEVAPVTRALADAIEALDDPALGRALLTEAVASGLCVPSAVARDLDRAGLLERPHVSQAVEELAVWARSVAEDRVYELVRDSELPDPVWNVSLHLPDGTFLAAVDAYWPEQGVTLDVDVRSPGFTELDGQAETERRERLEALGLAVLYVTPEKLHDAPAFQAAVVHTALRMSQERAPAGLVVALPR